MGYSAPSSGTFFGSNELLLDTSSTRRFTVTATASGGVDVFRSRMPCKAALAGVPIYVQAALFGRPVELCNALDVTPGYY
jgi:hypothetical protein